MSKRLLILLTLVFVALGLAAVTGCGSSDKGSSAKGNGETVEFDFAKAAEATKAEGSAEVSLTASVNDGKKTQNIAIAGKVDFKQGKADLSTDLTELLKQNGAPASGDGKVQVLVDGKMVWIKLPQVQGLTLPGGQSWISLDLEKAIDKLDLKSAAKGATSEPIGPVKMTKVGTETVDGVELTHLKADATLREILSGAGKQGAEAVKTVEKQDGGKDVLDQKLPAEVWVDSDNVLYRVKVQLKVADTKNPGEANIDLTMSNFGTDVMITPPADKDVFNATDLLLQFSDTIKKSLNDKLKTS